MRKKLAEVGRVMVKVGDIEVEVTNSERPARRYRWKTPNGKTHDSYYWPDEKIGEAHDYPTFYEVSAKYGLDDSLPAAVVWRNKGNQSSKKVTSALDNFQPEE